MRREATGGGGGIRRSPLLRAGPRPRREGTAEGVEQEIAESCPDGRASVFPDEERGGDRHRLPEDQERDDIASEYRTEARARVQEGKEVERRSGKGGGVQHREERDDREDVAREKGEGVGVQKDEFVLHERYGPRRSLREQERDDEGDSREHDEADPPRTDAGPAERGGGHRGRPGRGG